jgi:parallel beta-helix repeat protein
VSPGIRAESWGRASGSRRRAIVPALAALAIAAGLVGGPAGPASAATLSPDADTYVDAASPSSNFGGSTSLRVEGDPQRVAYLRYNPSGATTGVIKITSRNNSDHGFEVWSVADDSWGEKTTTWNLRPTLGQLLGTTGPIAIDRTYTVDVTSAMDQGPLSLAIVTKDPGGLTLTSREGGNPPRLIAPAPPKPSVFTIEKVGTSYRATSDLGQVYNGSVKTVVEQSVLDLDSSGGGTVQFTAGDFNLGTDNLELYHIARIVFAGAGMNDTVLRNATDQAADTEPFDFTVASEVTIRDLTVDAGGSLRSTSDAIDFDAGNDSVVERVKVTRSRARGIVFDGKGSGWTADRNVVRDCVITGVPADGIELLASRHNLVTGCTVTDSTGHGIQITKASTVADQPSKTSDDNQLVNNIVVNSGQDGINLNSGSRNLIQGNSVSNSSDDTAGRDGIRISGNDSIVCDDNVLRANTATDTQTPKTQKYGVNISTSLCHRTVLDSNNLAGNLTGPLRDGGSGTIIVTSGDTEPPTAPGSATATAISATRVDLSWTAGSDNVGVTGYKIYRDGSTTPMTTVPGTSLTFSDTAVSPATTYTYKVSAVDAAGNESSQTATNPVTTPTPTTQTEWVPVDDTYVSAASPTSSYGSSTSLRVDNDPVIRSYLRFTVANSEAGPHRTVLRIYANSSHSSGVDVRPVVSSPTPWTESTNYNSAPAVGDVLGSSGALSAGSYKEIDLGSLVTGDGTYELALTGRNTTAVSLMSSEASHPPQLVLRPAA